MGIGRFLWRGSLSERRTVPLGCVAVANRSARYAWKNRVSGFGAATRPNGGKPPRHRCECFALFWCFGEVSRLRAFS
ncbi:hypothetical protein FFH90_003630 [Pseudomonas sp. ATCC 43928]|nr:hypothetical protein FFH90_003630 [Pseudomonas sp. ATCC 43928]